MTALHYANTKAGQAARVQGGRTLGKRLYGYEYDGRRIVPAEAHKLTVAAAVYLQSARHYAELGRFAMGDLAAILGVSARTTLNLLKNPRYCGRYVWQGGVLPEHHPAILPTALFDAMQRLMTLPRPNLVPRFGRERVIRRAMCIKRYVDTLSPIASAHIAALLHGAAVTETMLCAAPDIRRAVAAVEELCRTN